MSDLYELIEKLESKCDRLRYYNEELGNPVDFIMDLVTTLRNVEEYQHDDCMTQDDVDVWKEESWRECKHAVIKEVLQNAKLKTRGEMIEAVEELERE